MSKPWSLDIVLELRRLGVSQKEFADVCGYSVPYMSQLLRGRKDTMQARQTMQRAIMKLAKELAETPGKAFP